MEVIIDGIKINYEIAGEGQDIFLLHGWGTQIGLYRGLINFLSRKNRVIALDMPGFGKSEKPPVSWGVPEYAEFVSKFIKATASKDSSGKLPILMGHSFGGKIIIYMTANKLVEARKLILFGSAGVKPKREAKYYIKVYSYKLFKKIALSKPFKGILGGMFEKYRNRAGSQDYKNAEGVMRESLVKVLNQHLTDIMPKIKIPTLLIWGENDSATPVSDGKLMEKLIPDSGLVVLKNAGHYAYAEKHHEFCLIVDNFISND